ncbi:MAG: penicillin-binding protein 1C [Synergistaceae bacterium]|nr:penicillin-binding protein 1C [Synergistaceae bacterium]
MLTMSAVGCGIAGLLFYFSVPEPEFRTPPSPALYDAEGKLFHVRLSREQEWYLPISLSEMGRWLPLVAVGVEDRRFHGHPGLDWRALLRALWQNARARRVVSGASTITSQVVRLAVSEREGRKRTFATKAREFAQAVKLERIISKNDILETYLNLAPFGGNIRGVQAASLIYFGKPASRLSPGEACLLVGMLKGPSLYRPDRRPEAARRRRDFVIRLLERRGVLAPAEARFALMEELPSRWVSLPWRAFHFAEMVLNGQDEDVSKISTTLNLELQTKLEAVLKRAVASLPANVTTAAGVVNNRTGGLSAWVGNARFGEEGRSSWVDCGLALRSPGSALKPFAYLSAFDKGLLVPGSLLADSPMAFSGRAPRNFDLTYRGAVSARVALADSLNAPAVRVLRLAGAEHVLTLMREMGLGSLNLPASHYGDSLILGGCEVTVFQALSAYSALANGGVWRPMALFKKKESAPGRRLASAAAAWMVTDALDNRGRLSTFARGTLGENWRVALKTGTSYGLRDAWAAAWTPDYTVVVWVGDPTGEPWPGLVGVRAAAPLALSIMRAIFPKPRWYGPPDGLELREVCALSGRPPTAACLVTRRDWAIRGVTRNTPCDIHVIRAGKSTLLWPSEMALQDAPLSEVRKQSEIVFSSPVTGATYYLAPLAKEQKIPLRVEGAAEKVWWYIDGLYIGASAPNETFFHNFPDGRHTISAVDAQGRTAAARVNVALPGKRRQESPPLL